jgi:hypothetical protein
MNEDKIKSLIVEYVKLVDFLIDEDLIYRFNDGSIGVERESLDKLLDKHAFFKVKEKLKLWKTLNFIVTEEKLYTKKKRIIKDNERVRIRFYIINKKTYSILKNTIN